MQGSPRPGPPSSRRLRSPHVSPALGTVIVAFVAVIGREAGMKVAEVIQKYSHDAEAVFLGLTDPEPGTEEDTAERLVELTNGLKTTILVRNAGEFAGNLI